MCNFRSRFETLGTTVTVAIALVALPAQSLPFATAMLDELLAEAPALAASLSNVSQNLGHVDSSVAIAMEQDFAGLRAGFGALAANRIAYGASVASGANATASDREKVVLAALGPVSVQLASISTTGVGALQSANLTGGFDADRIAQSVGSVADDVVFVAQTHGSIDSVLAMQNIAFNAGAVTAQIEVRLADATATFAPMTTTAIGALQTGALNTTLELRATVNGGMGDVTERTAALVMALVGS